MTKWNVWILELQDRSAAGMTETTAFTWEDGGLDPDGGLRARLLTTPSILIIALWFWMLGSFLIFFSKSIFFLPKHSDLMWCKRKAITFESNTDELNAIHTKLSMSFWSIKQRYILHVSEDFHNSIQAEPVHLLSPGTFSICCASLSVSLLLFPLYILVFLKIHITASLALALLSGKGEILNSFSSR